MYHLSRQYVRAGVWPPDGSVISPTAPCEMAILPYTGDNLNDEPQDDDWTEAENYGAGARLLVGPGSPFGVMTEGDYVVWVRVTANPEQPVMRAGILNVT